MEGLTTMRIGSGRTRTEDGTRQKIRGYAPRIGKSLAELLKENHEVKMVAMGDASGNNLVKGIAHAQALLQEEGKGLMANEFSFETVSFEDSERGVTEGKAVTVLVHLCD